MPTRKQRRRRQKELRHEWEEVYVDQEGRELDPEELDELVPARAPRSKQQATAGRPQGRGAPRGIQPPTLRRVLKRTAIFAPLMYVFLYIVSRNDDLGPQALIVQTLMLMLIFMPFSYLMDSLTYRLWKRRQERAGA